MELVQSCKKQRYSATGWMTAIAFASGPFLYLKIGNRGLFLYIAILFLLAMVVSILYDRGRMTYRIPAAFGIYVVFTMWQLIGFIWSANNGGNYLYEFAKNVVFFLLLSINIYNQKEKTLIQWVQTVVAVFLVIMMLTGEQSSKQGRYTFNLFGVEQDPNYMCLFLLMPFYWCLSIVMNPKTTKRIVVILCIAVLIILTIGFLATGSRGGLLGLIVGIVVYLVTYKKMNGKQIALLLLFVAIAIFVSLQIMRLLPEEIADRFRWDNILASEGAGRYEIWRRYVRAIFRDGTHMIVGSGTYASLEITAAHNYLLETWFENGLIGVILSIILYGKMVRNYIKTHSWTALATICGALAMSMSLSVGSMLQFWLCVASTIVLSNDGREKKTDEVI